MEGNQDYTSFFFLMLEFNLVAPYKGFCTISKSHKSDNKAIKNRPQLRQGILKIRFYLFLDFFFHRREHCKYIRPDYDGTLAIHSTPIVVATMPVVATTMNGQSSIVIWSYIFAVEYRFVTFKKNILIKVILYSQSGKLVF